MNIYANATHTRMYLHTITHVQTYTKVFTYIFDTYKNNNNNKNFTAQNHGKISQDAETIIIYLLSTAQYITVIRFIATVCSQAVL